ncbi:MAG: hypothetical protein A2189_04915 [Paenibacillus sp. RIFOXYA1_FULL_44_5]|nr:MAG: hypothetical protein A2189_04915 [Paenibacillus sp. RIFOXYA1_FULL_44_5]
MNNHPKDNNSGDGKLKLYQAQQYNKESGKQLHNEFSQELNEQIARNGHIHKNRHNDEEFASEFAEPVKMDREKAGDDDHVRIGWVALIVAIASLMIWPVVLGPTAAILGYIAFTRGNRGMGIWSIIIGFVAVITTLVFIPLYS